jgi:hypothetical protein
LKSKQEHNELLFERDQCGTQRELPRPGGWGIHNETCKGSLGSECLFLFRCEGIGIGNPNKSLGVFFFGTFLLDEQKKDTCYLFLSVVENNMKKCPWGAATGSAVRPSVARTCGTR